jgi:hypothetical protein
MTYGKPLTADQLNRLIDKLNDADDAQQSFIDSHRSGEIDPETEALYEATYELVSRLKDIVRFHLVPQVEGLIDMSKAYQ